MSIVKSLSVGEGDMFYIKHNSDNFTVIDCCLEEGKEDDIINYVIKDMNRGITALMAEGGYTRDKKRLLYVAVTTSQMISLKTKILRVDPKAFITIIDVSEVKGKGFVTL